MLSKKFLFWLAFSLYLGLPSISANAQATIGAVILFNNVRVFDGRSPALSAPSNVLIRGNIIERISREPIAVDRSAETRIIDGGGRTLMPGLSDMHWHAMLVRPTPAIVLGSDIGYTTLLAGAEATATLMRGFTTVRDMGGPSFSLKRAIDEGVLPGPRIYPSGAMISVTSGHGDFRQPTDLPRTIGGMLSRMEQLGGSMIADSPPRTAYAGRITDQVDRRRRRRVAVQPPRCIHLYRSRTSRCGRSGRELGNICGGARIHDRFDPASHRGRC
jgi:imidazolonepropionase-like amidohydrolase